jgi:hypothetical protein
LSRRPAGARDGSAGAAQRDPAADVLDWQPGLVRSVDGRFELKDPSEQVAFAPQEFVRCLRRSGRSAVAGAMCDRAAARQALRAGGGRDADVCQGRAGHDARALQEQAGAWPLLQGARLPRWGGAARGPSTAGAPRALSAARRAQMVKMMRLREKIKGRQASSRGGPNRAPLRAPLQRGLPRARAAVDALRVTGRGACARGRSG